MPPPPPKMRRKTPSPQREITQSARHFNQPPINRRFVANLGLYSPTIATASSGGATRKQTLADAAAGDESRSETGLVRGGGSGTGAGLRTAACGGEGCRRIPLPLALPAWGGAAAAVNGIGLGCWGALPFRARARAHVYCVRSLVLRAQSEDNKSPPTRRNAGCGISMVDRIPPLLWLGRIVGG
jgi:hypothetical protein